MQNAVESTVVAHSGFLVNTCDPVKDDRGDGQSQCVESEMDREGSQGDETKRTGSSDRECEGVVSAVI